MRRDAVKLTTAVIGDDHRIGTRIGRTSRIVARVDAFDDDRPAPCVADPLEVVPRERALGKRGADVGVGHRALARADDVRKFHEPAVGQEAGEPSGFDQELRQVRRHREKIAGNERRHAVAVIALAHAGCGRVDRHHEGGVAGRPGAVHGGDRDISAADEVELIPGRAGGRGLDFLERAARER